MITALSITLGLLLVFLVYIINQYNKIIDIWRKAYKTLEETIEIQSDTIDNQQSTIDSSKKIIEHYQTVAKKKFEFDITKMNAN